MFARRTSRLLALVAVAALVVVACSGDDDDTAGTEPGGGGATVDTEACGLQAFDEATGPVTVQFWHAVPSDNQNALTTLVQRFNESQDRVRVEASYQGNYRDAFTKYRTALRSGADLPDLVHLEETVVQQMIDSQSAVPMQACVDASSYDLSDYVPATIQYYTVEDVLQAMPWNVSNPMLIFNRAMFTAAGLDPDDPPTTLDGVRAAAEQIVAAGAAPAGMALRIEPFVVEFMFAKAQQLYVNEQNGRVGRATESELDSPTGVAIFTWIKGMIDDGLAISTGSQEGNLDHLFALANGNVAMTIDPSSVLGPALNILGAGGFPMTTADFEVGQIPSVTDTGGVPVGDGALWLVQGDDPAKVAAAWQFVQFLNEPENQAYLSVNTGYIPIRQSAVELPEVQQKWAEYPVFEVPYEQLLSGERDDASAGSVIGNYQGVRDAVRKAWQAMLSEGLSPEAAVAQAGAEATAAIQEYNSRVGG